MKSLVVFLSSNFLDYNSIWTVVSFVFPSNAIDNLRNFRRWSIFEIWKSRKSDSTPCWKEKSNWNRHHKWDETINSLRFRKGYWEWIQINALRTFICKPLKDINEIDGLGRTALHWASIMGHRDGLSESSPRLIQILWFKMVMINRLQKTDRFIAKAWSRSGYQRQLWVHCVTIRCKAWYGTWRRLWRHLRINVIQNRSQFHR